MQFARGTDPTSGGIDPTCKLHLFPHQVGFADAALGFMPASMRAGSTTQLQKDSALGVRFECSGAARRSDLEDLPVGRFGVRAESSRRFAGDGSADSGLMENPPEGSALGVVTNLPEDPPLQKH